MDAQRWHDPDWLARVHDWIAGRLGELSFTRSGAVEQSHVQPWSTVLRIPTTGGDVWFKATAESLRHEAALVERLAARRPDVLPPLLAVDTANGWTLMGDAGETLRAVTARERSLERWCDVLPRYAEVQLDLAADVEDLVALGVPDLRLAALPAAYERLTAAIGAEPRFRAAAPMVADLCEELAAYGLPELLQHDDLHDGQIFVRDGRYLLLDWGDACVSHPFFSLSVALEGVLAWGLDDIESSVDTVVFRDAYLAPYAERFPGDLAAATGPALRLGWVCRAINGHVAGDDGATRTRLRMFLDGRP